jgi:pimeloyl-ACP methyl ester carboxylesterase
MPTLQIDQGLELYYEDDNFTDPWRAAPVMLLQHGFSRNGRFWCNWVPVLGGEFRILRPDMRGMGRSTIPEASYDTRVVPPGLKEWYIAEMDRTSPAIARKLQAYLDTLDFREHLKEITIPTLLLVGADTPTSPLDQQEFMASQIPNCRLAVYPNLGHGINVLKPEWCAEHIRDFLASSTKP